MIPEWSRGPVWGDNRRNTRGEKLPIWEQNGLLVPKRKNKKTQWLTEKAANDVGEEMQLAILRPAKSIRWRQETD